MKKTTFPAVFSLIRARHWVKNLFVFAPLLFSGLWPETTSAVFAFVLFCLASSATYILNDLTDIKEDKKHAVKSRRPIASGRLSPGFAKGLMVFLLALLAAGLFYMPAVLPALTGYLLLNVLYNFGLKKQPLWDILSVAFGFILRVYAGAEAVGTVVSSWMFITTLCLTLFITALKRQAELKNSPATRSTLKFYTPQMLTAYTLIAGAGTLVFYTLFAVLENPALAPTVPVVLFGLFRYLALAEKGEDPVELVVRDPQMMAALALWTALCLKVYLP